MLSKGNNRSIDENVEQLENLKETVQTSKTPHHMSVLKSKTSMFSDVNGLKTGHKEVSEQLNENGKLVAKITEKQDLTQGNKEEPKEQSEIEIDIPSQGIHQTLTRNGEAAKREDENLETLHEKLNSLLSGVNYNPVDMAEYIFWTGDEKGVTSAIEEFLDQGVMSRDEAIAFLDAIKMNLDNIQTYYFKLKALQRKSAQVGQQLLENVRYRNNLYQKEQDDLKKRIALNALINMPKFSVEDEKTKRAEQNDVVEMPDHMRVVDLLYSEYTLEEVIYQLAKVMFSQSLTRGSKEAQKALQKFTNFLEAEAEQGQISRVLEKKILGVLVTALGDTLNEKPELFLAASQGLTHIEQEGSKKQLISKRSPPAGTGGHRQV